MGLQTERLGGSRAGGGEVMDSLAGAHSSADFIYPSHVGTKGAKRRYDLLATTCIYLPTTCIQIIYKAIAQLSTICRRYVGG